MATRKRAAKAGTDKSSAEQRRRLFIEAYLSNGCNGTQAALDAGFSPKSAASQASRLLKDAKVRQDIDIRRQKLVVKAELGTEHVLASLRQTLLFDPRKLYREDGTLRAVQELDDDTALALTGLEVEEIFGSDGVDTHLEPQPHGGGLKRGRRKVLAGHTVKIKWADKNGARDQLARILGMYEKDNRQHTDPLTDLLRDLMKAGTGLPIADAE